METKNYGTMIAKIMFIIALLITVIGIGSALAQSSSDSIPKLTKEVIYKDVKDVLKTLGETLKVGTEHVYEVLIKQQIVSSVTWVIIYIIALIVFFIMQKWAKHLLDKDGNDGGYIISYTYIVLVFIVFLFTIESTVTGFINPEYGAINKIISLLK